MAKCENEPKALPANKAKTVVDNTMSQFAGKTFSPEQALIWLACAIESEGSVQLTWGTRKDGYIQLCPRVNIGNKDEEYINRVVDFATKVGVHGSYSGYRAKKTDMRYVIWYGMKRVKRLLEAVKDLLHTRKRTIAELVLEFINYRLSVDVHVRYGERDEDIFFKVRALNGKGMISDQLLRDRFRARIPQKTKKCDCCGITFAYVRSDHQFCSRKCVDANYKLKESSTTTRRASEKSE